MSQRSSLLAAAQDLASMGSFGPAREALRRVLAEDPDDADALTLLAYCLRAEGRANEAHAAVTRALELEPEDPDALVELGWTSYVRHHDKAAGLCADAALAIDPHHRGAWWLRTEWAIYTKRYSKAEAAARELVGMSPSDADAHAYLGRALLARGSYAVAREALEEALRLDPEHDRARSALAGVAARERGEKREKRGPRWLPRPAWLFRRIDKAPRIERVRATIGAALLLIGILAAVRTEGAAVASLVVLGVWAVLRSLLWLACFGREDDSVAIEFDPTFGIAAAAYKTEAGFATLAAGDSTLAREIFRAVRVGQEYAPDARCGFRLASAPEWIALFPFLVSERNWERAPERSRRLRVAITSACVVAFALGVLHAVRGEAWPALMGPLLVALGATLAATAWDRERGRVARTVYLVTGAFVAAFPIAAAFIALPDWCEPTAWTIVVFRMLLAAGDMGERADAGTDDDPRSGQLWRSV